MVRTRTLVDGPAIKSAAICGRDIRLMGVFSIAGYPRVIPEPEVTRRLAKHRYSQLRIAPNPRIIHPKITRGYFHRFRRVTRGFVNKYGRPLQFFLLEDLETLKSIERMPVFIP
ncbi:hypothetical protein TNCV_548101 [Trichonephila clavipes]|nr:hypothetical protein TNCV_548101 [Trichonephila clavipes]